MLPGQEFRYSAPWVSFMTCKKKILTDDPDWALDIYEARALAMMFLRKRGPRGAGYSVPTSDQQRLDGHVLSEPFAHAPHCRHTRRSRIKRRMERRRRVAHGNRNL